MSKKLFLNIGIALLFLIIPILTSTAQSVKEKPEAFKKIVSNGYIPSWSPDGKFIVYGSTGPPFNVFKVRLSDLRVEQLTQNGGYHPAVSPDGQVIMYDTRGTMGTLQKIHFSDGSPAPFSKDTISGNFSCWSPDGKFIIYTNKGDLWQLNIKKGEISLFYASKETDSRPVWSPDGSKIAFDSGEPQRTGNAEIYVLGADGKDLKQLTDHSKIDAQPHWSPDGQWIAFMSEQSGNRDIWIMKADGSQKTQLTFDPGTDVWPRWSPDGTKIAFGSQRQVEDKRAFDIWVIDLAKQLGDDFFQKD